jgi:hypothetical protein
VATATERDTQPTPTGLIALTINDFDASSTPCCSLLSTPSRPCWPGHDGDDNTNTEPDNPTTDDANTNDPDLRLPS